MFISHNFLNLPTTIKQNSAVKATYTYLADGCKYKTINASGGGYDYVGSFKYNRTGSNITLESVAASGGRIYKTSNGYEARYFVSDHLGSTRLVANSAGTVLEQNDYMPYGERHANSALATSTNPYLYNGKESQKDFGINYIDSEARFQRLDGAFNSIDPLCEKYYHISPYAYCAGDPVNYIDPDGNSLIIKDIASIIAIFNGLKYGQSITIKTNDGLVDPMSIKEDAENSDDFFLKDIYEIANSNMMVELSTSDHYYYNDLDGNTLKYIFENTPKDINTSDFGEDYENNLIAFGEPLGKYISGNLGRTLVPMNSRSRSTNKAVQVIINANGKLAHRTVGIAHEFGHVLLYLNGRPHKHGEAGVDEFVYNRATLMSKRLGYDF